MMFLMKQWSQQKYVYIAVVLMLLTAQSVFAQWNGNPTGRATATDSRGRHTWSSTLNPNPALQMRACPWLPNALNVQGYNAANGWNITYAAALNGNITIDSYYAWVSRRPNVTIAGNTYPGDPAGTRDRKGGAVLTLNYQRGAGDPAGASVHWIQVIRTNAPSGGQTRFDEGNGYSQYLDNDRNPAGNPFYDTLGGAAGATFFADRPLRWCRGGDTFADWEAQTFLCIGNLATKQLTIYEKGVWWGFEFRCTENVPEPASMVALAVGLVSLLSRRRRTSIA